MQKLLLFLLTLTIICCSNPESPETVIVTGTVDGAQSAMIRGVGLQHEITLKEGGSFADTLVLENDGFYTFSVNRDRTKLYLEKGATINIAKNSDGYVFSGDHASMNNYFVAKAKNVSELRGDSKSFYALSEEAFKVKTEDIKSSNEALLNALENISPAVMADEQKNIDYDILNYYNNYEGAHAFYTDSSDFVISEGFLPKALVDLKYDLTEDYQISSSYRSLAFDHFMDPIFENLDDLADLSPDSLKVLEDIQIPALKTEIADYLGKVAISPVNEKLPELYGFIRGLTTDEKVVASIDEIYEKTKTLVKGSPSPKFVNYENHKGGTTSLDDLKGQYVYVDVWATWCGPCKREIPSLKKVEEAYHDKNIAFVSTSVDQESAHQTWVDMVKDKELGGIQLMADNSWQSDFVEDYAIKGIPRFILIDPEGNIVSADAPRPSDPALIDLFDTVGI